MSSTCMHVAPFTAASRPPSAQPTRPQRLAVRCSAKPSPEGTQQATRRNALLGMASMTALLGAAPARALIVDDSDEELIEKLAASRKAKLAQEKSVEKEFARAEGYDKVELKPVQRGVNKLAKSGAALEAGDVKAASAALTEGWRPAFDKAGKELSESESEDVVKSFTAVVAGIDALQATATSGDLKAAKSDFVAAVAALEGWVASAGIGEGLAGI